MAMWRRQEETKSSASSSEVPPPPRVQPPATPASGAAAPAPAPEASAPESSAPAGHLTIAHTIRGEITGREDLFVDGEVEGKICLDGAKITIGPNGRLIADIEAREIVVRGMVKGNLHGRDFVQIGSTGHVVGDVVTRYISIEEGAEVHGSFDVTRGEESRVTPITTSGEKAKSHTAL
jgi:cytoskeletal protein CcmA (bactofilin family)